MLKKKKQGFTLIELVAVIAILIILAVALVPQVSKYIEKSKKVAIQGQCREVVTVVEAYNATAEPGKIITYGPREILLAYAGVGSLDTKYTNATLSDILSIDDILKVLGNGSAENLLNKKFNKIPSNTPYSKIKSISEGDDFEIKDGLLDISTKTKTE